MILAESSFSLRIWAIEAGRIGFSYFGEEFYPETARRQRWVEAQHGIQFHHKGAETWRGKAATKSV